VPVYTLFTNEPLAQMVQQKAVRRAAETAGPEELCGGRYGSTPCRGRDSETRWGWAPSVACAALGRGRLSRLDKLSGQEAGAGSPGGCSLSTEYCNTASGLSGPAAGSACPSGLLLPLVKMIGTSRRS
jgi:hypothetical protein